MNKKQVEYFRSWFHGYVDRYRSGDPEIQKNIHLKRDHTLGVCREILDIAASLSLKKEEFYLAETMALFHDIGRFEQFVRYGTFSDWKSENHAELGIRILRKENVFHGLSAPEERLILAAVFWHNRAEPPEDGPGSLRFFSRLLRDADKLDIWRVVTPDYKSGSGSRNLVLEHGLPDEPWISLEVMDEALSGRPVSVRFLKTRNDFKLLHMSWIYDINFPRAFETLIERQYLEIIRDSLPGTDEVAKVYERAARYAAHGASRTNVMSGLP